MVEVSKHLFEGACAHGVCTDLVHPWSPSCFGGTAIILFNSIKGSYKFYAVLYVVQILLRGKKISSKFLAKQLRQYVFSGMFGFFVGTSFITFNCILRRLIFHKFHYYTMVFLPSFLSGFIGVHFEPPYRRYLVNSTFVNMVFEYWMRTLDYKGVLKRSTTRETLIFMLGSSYLFYLMRQELEKSKRMSFIWFFTPPKVNKEPVSNNGYIAGDSLSFPSYCPHKAPCNRYISMGTLQYFLLGSAMTLLRVLIPRMGTPMKALKSVTRKHFSLGMFLGGYIGIYRLITCMLCRNYKRDSAKFALPAGFLAGSAFWFNPNLSISLASVTSILHIMVSRMYDNKMLPENIPLPELLYALCQGILFHARIMHPEMCPRYIFNLLSTVTSKKVNLTYDRFLKILAAAS